ncbi:COG1470 family protein [Geomonas azotofigens]|uniref:COG1470 family protein n=1 Tax=Geomonas azotofigens TaxID=2843196 RepID=UPI001F1C24D9|nr:DUF11 domain-containing protein [Geomonas azotofigens]
MFFLFFMGNGAFAAGRPDLMVRLASETDAAYIGEGIYESTATVQSRSQPSYPGLPAQFRVLLKNAGDQPDRFLLTAPGSGGAITVSYLDATGADLASALSGSGYLSAPLAPGESLALLVRVNPTTFTLGASYRVAVTALSIGDPQATDQVKTETVACVQTAAVTVSAPPDGSGAPGTVVNYPYTVKNVGNGDNAFALTVTMASGWRGELFADDGAGGGIAGDGVRQSGESHGCLGTGTLAPGASYRFFLAVTVPEAGGDGARGESLLAVSGTGANGTDQVTTTVVAAAVFLTEGVRNLTRGGIFAANAEAVPGDLLQYRMAVTNGGSAPATSVSIDSPIPAGLVVAPDSLLLSLASTGAGAPCAAAECGQARIADGSVIAQLGEGATVSSGGTLAPGKTIYLYFKAQVQ